MVVTFGQKGLLALDEVTLRRDISRKAAQLRAEALIADASPKRNTMATVTKAIARMGFLEDLDIVERMLDEDLKRKEKQLADFIARAGARTRQTKPVWRKYSRYRGTFSHLKSEASSKVLENRAVQCSQLRRNLSRASRPPSAAAYRSWLNVEVRLRCRML